MGKGSSVVSLNEVKGRYRDELGRYENDRNFNKEIRMKTYIKGTRFLLVHFKFPSKSVDIEYDVVFEFDLKTFDAMPDRFDNLNFRVFSNCPSFMYTYAFVFDAQEKLIPWLKSRFDKEVFKKKPTTRNPYQIQGIERSIYICGLYLLSGGRNNVRFLLSTATKLDNPTFLENNIKTQDYIMSKYNYLKKKQQVEKREEDKRNKSRTTPNPKVPTPSHPSNSIKTIASTSKVDKVGMGKNKKTQKTKKTKHI